MTSEKSSAHKTGSILQELPTVDWLDLARNREKFLNDLRYALSDCGFLVLTNAPGLDDDFQQRAFREVRGFLMHRWISKRPHTFPIRPISEVTPCRHLRTGVTGK